MILECRQRLASVIQIAGCIPVDSVQCPEDLLPRLALERAQSKSILRLVHAEPVCEGDAKRSVFQEPGVVGGVQAVTRGECQALQRSQVGIRDERLE